MTGCLGGIRVIETAGISAALAGRLLADLGAGVSRIVRAGSAAEPPDVHAYYHSGKRPIVIDPRDPDAAGRVLRLLAEADVWIDTPPPGEKPFLDLDPVAIAAENPRLVIARITPFGSTGPFARFRASDLVAQAAGGMAFTNGFADAAPLQGFGLQAYHSASLHAATGILLALFERERSGRGQMVDVSLQEAVAATVEEASSAWNSERRIARRQGTLHWSRLFRVGRSRDGWILFCLLCDWTTLHEWLKERGEGGDLVEPEWDQYLYRRQHCERLFDALDRWAATQSSDEIYEGSQLRRIPFAIVRPPEALRDDPQLRDRGFFAAAEAGVKTSALGNAPEERLSANRAPMPFRLPPRETTLRRPRPPAGRPRRALDGVRVLDFTHVVAGPVATRILADHGAEVIKVERRVVLEQGDRRRGFFSNLNRGKKSIVIDMAQARGIELARRLAAASDVVIDNFSARVMGNWGLDYEGLRALRSDVIAIGLSGFGKTGPQRDYVSFGPTLQALTGFTSLMRHPGGEPAGWGYSYSDMAGGLAGALAVLAALVERSRTGEGRFIDLSQLECVASLLGPALFAIARGETVEPAGNGSQEGPAAPHGIYRAAGPDRWVAIAVLDDDDWRRAAGAIAEPWSDDARFSELSGRLAHRAELDAALERWTRERSPEEVTALLQSHGVAAFTVADGEDLCARDPHLQARGYWVRFPTAEGKPAVLDGVAVKLSATPGFVAAPGPLHGEHTDEVLRSAAGLGDDEISELRTSGVIL